MTFSDNTKCSICGQPMPTGEGMFKFHGHSGPCPEPEISDEVLELAKAFHNGPLMADDHEFVADSGQGKWCIDVAQFFTQARVNRAKASERYVDVAYAAATKALAGTSGDIGAGELERVVIAVLDAIGD